MKAEDEILERAIVRLSGEKTDEDLLTEYTDTVVSRLCIRLGEETVPEAFFPIAADAVVKMHRRMYYEGIQSEGASGLSTTFVSSILGEYDQEIAEWKRQRSSLGGGGKVRFL